ncbi:hypothetical protein CLOM_g10762 [Closterium sp. NIES-68]|nr:hypothetical protein CLOM_g10762 [Closterium sp. NIES-68]
MAQRQGGPGEQPPLRELPRCPAIASLHHAVGAASPQGTNAPAAEQGSSKQQVVEIGAERWQQLRVHVVSANNFPTAAGLASSAAGFACLVFALAELMGVKEAYPGELSAIARMGSGSACRSLYGGFVTWDKGELPDGTDSMARQVKAEDHWSDLVIIIAVVEEREKDIGSSDGMKRSAQTSALLQLRAQHVVPGRITAMEAAIAARDFPAFARLTCADSNQFHATCLDTAPPIFYLNATSRRVIGFVEEFNAQGGQPRAAYTFDAGPNAVMFVERQNATAFLSAFLLRFPPPPALLSPASSLATPPSSPWRPCHSHRHHHHHHHHQRCELPQTAHPRPSSTSCSPAQGPALALCRARWKALRSIH